MCAAVAVDKTSVVVDVAGARLSLPRDVPLSYPIPNLSTIDLFTSSAVSVVGAELHDVPRGEFEGQGLRGAGAPHLRRDHRRRRGLLV